MNGCYTLRDSPEMAIKEEAPVRVFWSVMLTGGLLLVGLDVFESRRDRVRPGAKSRPAIMMGEDGTPLPPPPPPPQE